MELDLFTQPPRRDGETYDHAQDAVRLAAQHQRVAGLMMDGAWRTLAEISAVTGDPESSVSARLRDLRKVRFGGFEVDRRRRSKGQFEYRIAGRKKAEAA